jgi:hypothetical protein
MYKMLIKYRYFTFLNNFMFTCRQTFLSFLSSSFKGSNIPMLCVDVYTKVVH